MSLSFLSKTEQLQFALNESLSLQESPARNISRDARVQAAANRRGAERARGNPRRPSTQPTQAAPPTTTTATVVTRTSTSTPSSGRSRTSRIEAAQIAQAKAELIKFEAERLRRGYEADERAARHARAREEERRRAKGQEAEMRRYQEIREMGARKQYESEREKKREMERQMQMQMEKQKEREKRNRHESNDLAKAMLASVKSEEARIHRSTTVEDRHREIEKSRASGSHRTAEVNGGPVVSEKKVHWWSVAKPRKEVKELGDKFRYASQRACPEGWAAWTRSKKKRWLERACEGNERESRAEVKRIDGLGEGVSILLVVLL